MIKKEIYPKTKRVSCAGDKVYVTEKLDGSNLVFFKKDDEFYTMYKDCVRELHKYDLRGKRIICPCDNKESNIYKYLKDCYYDVKCDDKEWRKIV